MPLIPVLERKKQTDLCESESSLVYIVNSSIVRTTEKELVSKNKNTTTKRVGSREKPQLVKTPAVKPDDLISLQLSSCIGMYIYTHKHKYTIFLLKISKI